MKNWIIFFFSILLPVFYNSCNYEIKSKKSSLLESENLKQTMFDNFSTNHKCDTIYEYYNNGNIKKEIPLLNGDTSGIVKFFYINGKISEVIEYSNNKKSGIHEIYYFNGKIKQIKFHKIIQNISFYNGSLHFDSVGNILNDKSDYIGLYIHQDTIKLGEQFNYEFEIIMPGEIRGIAYVANFNSDFVIRDSSTLEKLYENKVYSYLPNNIGQGIFRVKFNIVIDTLENDFFYSKIYYLEAPYYVSMP